MLTRSARERPKPERQGPQRCFRASFSFCIVVSVICSETAIARDGRHNIGPVAQQHVEDFFQHAYANLRWVMLSSLNTMQTVSSIHLAIADHL